MAGITQRQQHFRLTLDRFAQLRNIGGSYRFIVGHGGAHRSSRSLKRGLEVILQALAVRVVDVDDLNVLVSLLDRHAGKHHPLERIRRHGAEEEILALISRQDGEQW